MRKQISHVVTFFKNKQKNETAIAILTEDADICRNWMEYIGIEPVLHMLGEDADAEIQHRGIVILRNLVEIEEIAKQISEKAIPAAANVGSHSPIEEVQKLAVEVLQKFVDFRIHSNSNDKKLSSPIDNNNNDNNKKTLKPTNEILSANNIQESKQQNSQRHSATNQGDNNSNQTSGTLQMGNEDERESSPNQSQTTPNAKSKNQKRKNKKKK